MLLLNAVRACRSFGRLCLTSLPPSPLSLVSKLHSSNKKKEQTLMAQSNANLAEELQHLRFQPELNKKSQEQAKGVNPLLERQAGMMEKKVRWCE